VQDSCCLELVYNRFRTNEEDVPELRIKLRHDRLPDKAECLGMELHDLVEVREEIGETVVAGIGMILVRNILLLQLLV